MKRVRDALRNLETSEGAVDVVRLCAFAGDPSDDRPDGARPPTSKRLQNEWARSDAGLGALGRRVEERLFAGLNRRRWQRTLDRTWPDPTQSTLIAAGSTEDPNVGLPAGGREGIGRVWVRRAVVVNWIARD